MLALGPQPTNATQHIATKHTNPKRKRGISPNIILSLRQIHPLAPRHRSEAGEQLHIHVAADDPSRAVAKREVQASRMVIPIAALAMIYRPGRFARVVFEVAQRPGVHIDLADRIGVAPQGPKWRSI